jgi:hypothetical protein
VRHTHGTEKAKEIAHHTQSSNSLVYYDNVGYGDIGLQQFRLGGPETMSRADIRKFYSQTNLARWKPAEDEELKLTESLDQAVLNQLLEQPDYIAEELEVRSLYDGICDKLEDLQAAGSMTSIRKIPTGYSSQACVSLKGLCYQHDLREFVQRIDSLLANRKSLYRSLRLKLRKAVTQE